MLLIVLPVVRCTEFVIVTGLNLTGTQFVDLGEPIILLCYINGVTRAPEDIYWYKNGERIVPSSHKWSDRAEITKRIEGRKFISTLTIQPSTLGDIGVYVCRGSELSINSMRVEVLSSKYHQDKNCKHKLTHSAPKLVCNYLFLYV